MSELSNRAIKMLARMKAGEFYPVDSSYPKLQAMTELENAGLVGTMGRVANLIRCYVPLGAQSFRMDAMEPTPQHLVMGRVGMYDDRREWPAALFDRLDDAEGFVALMTDLGTKARAHANERYDYPTPPEWTAAEAACHAEDPKWDFDYNAPATYTIVEMFPR